MQSTPSLGSLVVSSCNESVAVHRWFRYKEAYSAHLLETVLALVGAEARKRLVLVDPYCGVGTSLLSAQIVPNRIRMAIGIERNPFVAFIARSKLSWRLISAGEISRLGETVLFSDCTVRQTLPELSSIRSGRCISKHIAGRLLSIRESILDLPKSPTRDALMVGFRASFGQGRADHI